MCLNAYMYIFHCVFFSLSLSLSFVFYLPPFSQLGEIDWDEFCTYMMQDLQDKEDLGNEREVIFSSINYIKRLSVFL